MLLLIIWAMALAGGFANVVARRSLLTRAEAVEVLLMYQLALCYGFYGLFGFVAQAILPDQTAAGMGWASHHQFQWELGAFELGWGVASLLALAFRHRLYWLAVALPTTIMLPLAAWLEIRAGLSGAVPWTRALTDAAPNLLVPATVAVLLAMLFKKPQEERVY